MISDNLINKITSMYNVDLIILDSYNINYKNRNISSVIFEIESVLNYNDISDEDYDKLDNISSVLSEISYYNNTDK